MIGKTRGIFALLCFGLSLYAGVLIAADCQQTTRSILERIKKLDTVKDREELLDLLACLYAPATEMTRSYDSFIKPQALSDLESSTHEDRLDVIRILVPMMATKDLILKSELVAALAFYKYPPVEQLLAAYPDGPLKAVFYTILDYKRSYLWGIDQLERSLRADQDSDSSVVAERMSYLNLLYYMAKPESLPYLHNFLESSAGEMEKKRAQLAIERIRNLHPDIR